MGLRRRFLRVTVNEVLKAPTIAIVTLCTAVVGGWISSLFTAERLLTAARVGQTPHATFFSVHNDSAVSRSITAVEFRVLEVDAPQPRTVGAGSVQHFMQITFTAQNYDPQRRSFYREVIGLGLMPQEHANFAVRIEDPKFAGSRIHGQFVAHYDVNGVHQETPYPPIWVPVHLPESSP